MTARTIAAFIVGYVAAVLGFNHTRRLDEREAGQ